jgi:hypothetical protein
MAVQEHPYPWGTTGIHIVTTVYRTSNTTENEQHVIAEQNSNANKRTGSGNVRTKRLQNTRQNIPTQMTEQAGPRFIGGTGGTSKIHK